MDTTLVSFPGKPPSKIKIQQILQITFNQRPCADGSQSDLIEVWARNTLIAESSDNPYFWRYMPSTYSSHLHRILFHLELLKRGSIYYEGNREHLIMVHKYLLYVDHILDRIWDDSRKAGLMQEMNGSWRSPVLDRWLTVEYYIQRHMPLDIEVFEEEDVSNVGLLDGDPFHLGIYDLFLISNYTFNPSELIDWDMYEQHVIPWMNGSAYGWNIDNLTQHDKDGIISKYILAFFAGDDEESNDIYRNN